MKLRLKDFVANELVDALLLMECLPSVLLQYAKYVVSSLIERMGEVFSIFLTLYPKHRGAKQR